MAARGASGASSGMVTQAQVANAVTGPAVVIAQPARRGVDVPAAQSVILAKDYAMYAGRQRASVAMKETPEFAQLLEAAQQLVDTTDVSGVHSLNAATQRLSKAMERVQPGRPTWDSVDYNAWRLFTRLSDEVRI